MKILYITSLFSQRAGSGSIQNLGYINGLSEVLGRENIDVLTIRWPESIVDQRMLAMTKASNIYYDEIDIINRYFQQGGKERAEKILGNSQLLRKIKKLIVEAVYFPSVDKQWIKSYSNLDFSQYECIITSSDTKTSHFVGMDVKRRFPNLRWIQIWGDPWSTDITIESITRMRAKPYELRLLNCADIVFYVSEPTLVEMIALFPECSKKMHYVPRGYASEVVGRAAVDSGAELVLLYSGLLNHTRDIAPLCRAIAGHNKSSSVKVKLRICGTLDSYTSETIKQFGFVDYAGLKDYIDILDEYKNCDALLYIGNPSGASQIPGKLFDYMGTNRPILGLVYNTNDNVSMYLEGLNRITISANEEASIGNALIKIKREVLDGKQAPYSDFSGASVMRELLSTSESFFKLCGDNS